jgi:AraC-like DNA-binding protein
MRDVQPDGDVHGPGDCVDRSPALSVAKSFGRLSDQSPPTPDRRRASYLLRRMSLVRVESPGGISPGQGEGDLLLAVNVLGCSLARQRDTELSLRDGDALFWTRSLAGIGIMRFTLARFLGCRVARAEVAALLGRLDDTPMCFVPRDTEALQLLVTYARGIAEAVPLATPELQLAVSHMHDLMAEIIAATRGGRATAEGRCIPAARLRSIMIDIRAHLGDGDLSVAEVAQRQRVTPRYVHKLFESEGFTFSSFVRDQRLACAHRMLGDPRLADRTHRLNRFRCRVR